MDLDKKIDIVIARYKENIDWINRFNNTTINNIFIYNKFYDLDIKLPNVGREAHTYLYHIINNYNNLNDITIFLQGDPFPHCRNLYSIVDNIHNMNYDILPFNNIIVENEQSINRKHKILHPYGLFLAYFMDLLFGIKMDIDQTVTVTYGAQFACTKQTILNRPREFYEFLLKFVSYDTNPIESYIFERLWLYIFDTSIPLSNKYLNFNCIK